ncbi:MAG: YaeQ family protein [Candidatus Binatia bacterium]|nr:YaeQ family protein [Candidatus Binatia bacterium]
MAQTATIYTLQVELSDIDRNVFESVSLRVAQHPSEDMPRLVTRVLAYCLLYGPDLEFGRGLSNAEEPALWHKELDGRIVHWIDVGHPSADRMHRASKAANKMTIVTHKDLWPLQKEAGKRAIHRADEVEVWRLPGDLVSKLAELTTRKSQWVVVYADGGLMVTVDDASEPLEGVVERHRLATLSGPG